MGVVPLGAVRVLDLVLLDSLVELPDGDPVKAGRLGEIDLQPRRRPRFPRRAQRVDGLPSLAQRALNKSLYLLEALAFPAEGEVGPPWPSGRATSWS